MALIDILSRRSILVGLGATAAGAATVGGVRSLDDFAAILRPLGQKKGGGLPTGESGDWQLQIGSRFVADSGHTLELTDVQLFPLKGTRPKELRDRAFAATFGVVKGGPLRAGLYNVRHPSAGVFPVAFDTTSKPSQVVAIFN